MVLFISPEEYYSFNTVYFIPDVEDIYLKHNIWYATFLFHFCIQCPPLNWITVNWIIRLKNVIRLAWSQPDWYKHAEKSSLIRINKPLIGITLKIFTINFSNFFIKKLDFKLEKILSFDSTEKLVKDWRHKFWKCNIKIVLFVMWSYLVNLSTSL